LRLHGWWIGIWLLACASAASAQDVEGFIVQSFAQSSARIFRGRCVGAEPVTVRVPGGRVAATRYSFEVIEAIKGLAGARRTAFIQVGDPAGGALDLGRLAGLPTYSPGGEYVLFLLPESRRGLTSPAGAAEGAFLVTGDRMVWLPGPHGALLRERAIRLPRVAARAAATPLSYVRLRAAAQAVAP
jgi:hypothetical protein